VTAARPHDVIVIGASAGGIPALKEVVGGLPGDLPAAVLVVLHVNPGTPSLLPAILERAGALPVRHATDGDRIEPGCVLVAPPDLQMTVVDGTLRVERGPRENGMRPAIDPLMRSAAKHLGPRAVGVVLTGMLADGTVGLAAIKAAGGATVVQDPGTAAFASMPTHAIEGARPDHVVRLDEMPELLERIVRDGTSRASGAVPVSTVPERAPVEVGDDERGRLTAFTCPECSGTLWEVNEGGVPTFHCRVGHRYAVDALVAAQSDTTESTLWAAARALEEKASLHRRVARRLSESGHPASALRFERTAEDAEVQAAQIKLLIEQLEAPPLPIPVGAA
jgi:two-component system, chemotaxis family, protein-glutamate methylesterase/glutaminase